MKRLVLVLTSVLLFGGCDSGPSGPGDLTGILETPGPVLGGALLEVTGRGITKFSDSGSTRVFAAATEVPETYRVILMAEIPGELRFRVSVQDKGAKRPAVSVVSVVSGENMSLPATADYRVRFSKK